MNKSIMDYITITDINFRKILNNNDLLIVLFLREGEEDKREKEESKDIINLLAWLKNVEQKNWWKFATEIKSDENKI